MRAFLSVLTLLLFGCGMGPQPARFYPANDVATPTGVLSGEYDNNGTGAGSVTVQMPDGEVLRGEYLTVDNSSNSFGTIYTRVYGAGWSASGVAGGGNTISPGSSPGTVALYGNRGTSMQCEYIVNNSSGHGAGGCQTSKGALYKLHF